MSTQKPPSSSGRPALVAEPDARPWVVALLAYVSAVSASVGAVAAVVGAGIPLDLLMAVA
ncbi:MAG: hypothetical protein M3Q12_12695 [Pseudomonadota bacterium]|uniref:hypothetical protein n=1 Tax=Polaromonas sp. TaxID=1869339 RepID=UPI001839A3BC|nr:hypothetical protein [Polaromonas sp.]MBA3594231.1 hypothetical protein [Polaromonas sp.]MDQ3273008.1 hypothetical protein [Pseudomonadota bacterium]